MNLDSGKGVSDSGRFPWGSDARSTRCALTSRDHPSAAGDRLDPAFAEKLLNFIIAEVIRHHETIAKSA